jgi:hypothetical protein
MSEFICTDCGCHVFQAIAEDPTPDPPLCFMCQWLRTLDPEDREAIARFVNKED